MNGHGGRSWVQNTAGRHVTCCSPARYYSGQWNTANDDARNTIGASGNEGSGATLVPPHSLQYTPPGGIDLGINKLCLIG